MTTTATRESESTTTITAPAAPANATPVGAAAVAPAPVGSAPANAGAAPAAAAVNIAAVPETPAELLKQWPAARRRPLVHTVIAAALVRIWDALTGPGMTDQERTTRAIAEHNGFIRNLGRKL